MATRRRILMASGAAALVRALPTSAQEATPEGGASDTDDAGIVGFARRAFRFPNDDGDDEPRLDANAVLFDGPDSAAASFPEMIDLFGAMLGAEADPAALPPQPTIGDQAAAWVAPVGGDGSGLELAVVGFREGAVVVIVSAIATAGAPLPDALHAAESAHARSTATSGTAGATPTAGATADDLFALLPSLDDVPAGMVVSDEDAFGFDDE